MSTRVTLMRTCGRDKLVALMFQRSHEDRELRIATERHREEDRAEQRRQEAAEKAELRRKDEELRRSEAELRRSEAEDRAERRRKEDKQDRMMMMMMAFCKHGTAVRAIEAADSDEAS